MGGLKEPRRFDERNLPDVVDCPDPLGGGGFQISAVLNTTAKNKEAKYQESCKQNGKKEMTLSHLICPRRRSSGVMVSP